MRHLVKTKFFAWSLFYLMPVFGLSSASEQFHLITFLYDETHEIRQEEYLHCLKKNLEHKDIATIDIFFDCENSVLDESYVMLGKIKQMIEEMDSLDCVSIVPQKGRPTFNDMVRRSQVYGNDAVIVVANADIFFDASLARVTKRHLDNTLLAISRWEPVDGIFAQSWPRAAESIKWRPFNQVAGRVKFEGEGWALCSQDVWIFKTPLTCYIPEDIVMGLPGCDNRIPYWASIGGYKLLNPVLDVRCYHMHESGIRNTTFTGKFSEDAAGVFAGVLPEPESEEWSYDDVYCIDAQ